MDKIYRPEWASMRITVTTSEPCNSDSEIMALSERWADVKWKIEDYLEALHNTHPEFYFRIED